MNKKHIITVAGKPGSGKSTASKDTAATLDYKHFSSGDLFRSIAKERGIDIYAINLVAETEREIDYQVDERLRQIGETEDNLIIDSRMAWHWMPYSFKVYLDLDLEVAAARILAKMDPARMAAEEIPSDPSEYVHRLHDRLDSEIKRYKNLYNADPYDTANYDLVVDTEKNNPVEVVSLITEEYAKWLEV